MQMTLLLLLGHFQSRLNELAAAARETGTEINKSKKILIRSGTKNKQIYIITLMREFYSCM
jgi:hypothetical protein